MQHNAYQFNGTIVHEEDVPGFHHSYRFHMVDPIRFEKRIKVTFEHGHANHLSDDWSSTAYWYQTLPSPVLTVPDVEMRLPLRPVDRVVRAEKAELTEPERAARSAAAERMERFVAARDAVRGDRQREVDAWEASNAEIARDVRARFDQGAGN
jgi:hypothetical protein